VAQRDGSGRSGQSEFCGNDFSVEQPPFSHSMSQSPQGLACTSTPQSSEHDATPHAASHDNTLVRKSASSNAVEYRRVRGFTPQLSFHRLAKSSEFSSNP
jgi:hypothetical protein